MLVVALMVAAAGGTLVEALLFRGLLDINTQLNLAGQRASALAALWLFSMALLLLEIPMFATGLRLGRQIENRLAPGVPPQNSPVGRPLLPEPSDVRHGRAQPFHASIAARPGPGRAYAAGARDDFHGRRHRLALSGRRPCILAALPSTGIPLAAQPLLVERDLRCVTIGGAWALLSGRDAGADSHPRARRGTLRAP